MIEDLIYFITVQYSIWKKKIRVQLQISRHFFNLKATGCPDSFLLKKKIRKKNILPRK
jgi:hypothetical protein